MVGPACREAGGEGKRETGGEAAPDRHDRERVNRPEREEARHADQPTTEQQARRDVTRGAVRHRAGRSSVVLARRRPFPKPRTYLSEPGPEYFVAYAWSTACRIPSLRTIRAEIGTVRPPTWISPTGSRRRAWSQPVARSSQERTKTRPRTTTAQMPMNRCGSEPARIRRDLLASSARSIRGGNRRAAGMGGQLRVELGRSTFSTGVTAAPPRGNRGLGGSPPS